MPPGARQRLAHEWALLTGVEHQLEELDAARHALPIDLTTPTGRAVERLQRASRHRPRGRLGVGDGDLWVARDSKCAATRGAGRRRPSRVSKWRHASGSWHHARRESARASPDGTTRVGMAPLAAEQNAEPVVSRPLATGGPRLRRIGIVALARKLLVALWRYVDHDVLPDGAVMKATTCRSRERSATLASRTSWCEPPCMRADSAC